MLLDYISSISHELGLEILCDRQRHRVRLERAPTGAHYREVLEALTMLGERMDPQPPTFFEPQMIKRAVKPDLPPPPTKTIWEHLHDDSDGI
jgi:hypothetical protein